MRAIERHELDGPVDEWRATREAIRAEVLEKGFNAERNAFVQSYDTTELDASLLMLPLVHFLPATDPRMRGTVEAIMRELMPDGLVQRYRTEHSNDGLPPGEGTFLACTFWLVDNLALQGRIEEATGMFEGLLALRNDVGLLSEEWDHEHGRMTGNFPQALTHVGLVNSAFNLDRAQRQLAQAVRAA